jgi:hypothetical protein
MLCNISQVMPGKCVEKLVKSASDSPCGVCDLSLRARTLRSYPTPVLEDRRRNFIFDCVRIRGGSLTEVEGGGAGSTMEGGQRTGLEDKGNEPSRASGAQ